ncbi:hypothetical protein Hanom_Chr11g01060231 [Helianthus anomalus]
MKRKVLQEFHELPYEVCRHLGPYSAAVLAPPFRNSIMPSGDGYDRMYPLVAR